MFEVKSLPGFTKGGISKNISRKPPFYKCQLVKKCNVNIWQKHQNQKTRVDRIVK